MMVTIKASEKQAIIDACQFMLEELPDNIADEIDLWRETTMLGSKLTQNVLHVRVRRKKGGMVYERFVPVWPH